MHKKFLIGTSVVLALIVVSSVMLILGASVNVFFGKDENDGKYNMKPQGAIISDSNTDNAKKELEETGLENKEESSDKIETEPIIKESIITESAKTENKNTNNITDLKDDSTVNIAEPLMHEEQETKIEDKKIEDKKIEDKKVEDKKIEDNIVNTEIAENNIAKDDDSVKYIAITFDDGPDKNKTGRLLDILKENNAKATFFVLGHSIEANTDIIKRMADEGHEIGNHTYNHKDLTKINEDEFNFQIDKTNELIENITGKDVTSMRPSYGARNESVVERIKNKNMQVILWFIDPEDWKIKDADAVSKHIISKAKDGDIILLHDIYDTSVDAAKIAIEDLSKKGFKFVTVTELIQHYGEIQPGGIYRSGRGTVSK